VVRKYQPKGVNRRIGLDHLLTLLAYVALTEGVFVDRMRGPLSQSADFSECVNHLLQRRRIFHPEFRGKPSCENLNRAAPFYLYLAIASLLFVLKR
jgi:hypothetical protein